MVTKIKNILTNILPENSNIIVSQRNNSFGGGAYIKIAFSPNTKQINDVRGQFAQVVSLKLQLDTLELTPQIFGGNGGKCIYRKPNLNNPKEKNLAMSRIVIPFRKPKTIEKNVLDAIKRFVENYIKALKENIDTLMHQNIIDYKEYLK